MAISAFHFFVVEYTSANNRWYFFFLPPANNNNVDVNDDYTLYYADNRDGCIVCVCVCGGDRQSGTTGSFKRERKERRRVRRPPGFGWTTSITVYASGRATNPSSDWQGDASEAGKVRPFRDGAVGTKRALGEDATTVTELSGRNVECGTTTVVVRGGWFVDGRVEWLRNK